MSGLPSPTSTNKEGSATATATTPLGNSTNTINSNSSSSISNSSSTGASASAPASASSSTRRASISSKRLSAQVIPTSAADQFRKAFEQGQDAVAAASSSLSSSTSHHHADFDASHEKQRTQAPLSASTSSSCSSSSVVAAAATTTLASSTSSNSSITNLKVRSTASASHPSQNQATTVTSASEGVSMSKSTTDMSPDEVGLGLMLDTGSGSTRTSLEANGPAATRSTSPASSSVAANGSSNTLAQPAPTIAGKAAANARDLLNKFDIEDEVSIEERPNMTRRNTLTGSNGSPSSASSTHSLANGNGSHSPILSRRGDNLPRLSTVTTSTGSTASPLMIFTGSPNPTGTTPRSVSPSTSTRSPLPSPSPQHTAYAMPMSANRNGPPSSSINTPTSGTMSRQGSVIGSSAMDRNASGSKSRNSDVHSRHQSLTSACAPVTSSYANTTPELGSNLLASLGSNGISSASAYPPSPTASQRGWKVYDWGLGGGGAGTPGKEKESYVNGTRSDDEDPRKGAKGGNGSNSKLDTIVGLPSTLLALFLAPLYGSPRDHAHYSPTLNASTAPTAKAKRYPLPIRIFLLAYLVFSTAFFGLHLGAIVTGRSSPVNKRLGPRGEELVFDGQTGARELTGKFRLGKVGAEWAQRVAEGVRWSKIPFVPVPNSQVDALLNENTELDFETIRRVGSLPTNARRPEDNPLTPFTHTYRFAKMQDKIHWDLHDEIVPFAFKASSLPAPEDITACLYSNEAWLSVLPAFVRAWNGPVTLVFESAHSRTSALRLDLVKKIAALRDSDDMIREFVDFHFVGAPVDTSEHSLNRTRERMIERPLAHNFHMNLARFFAPTDMIFIVGDPRVTPSAGLKRRLNGATVRDLVLSRGDAVVVPTFAFIRDPKNDPKTFQRADLHKLRSRLDLPSSTKWAGVGQEEFDALAAEHIRELEKTLPLDPSQWPAKKASLVPLVNTRAGSLTNPTNARLALFDRKWDVNHGPTNWYLWRKSATDARLLEKPESGGGVGLGVGGRVGGGNDVYRVLDYDLHYAPFVVVSKRGQPWCTERFEEMPAACIYQMYLAGAEMWVLPDEWIFTLEMIEKRSESVPEDPAEKLKNSISSRLYGKFHQEACMHYGRELLSLSMWNSEKAQNLRKTCIRTTSSWGLGSGL